MFKNRIVSELLAAARGKPSESPPEGREEAGHLQEQLRSAVSGAERFISEYPVAALGSALVAGVLLGWWIKRR